MLSDLARGGRGPGGLATPVARPDAQVTRSRGARAACGRDARPHSGDSGRPVIAGARGGTLGREDSTLLEIRNVHVLSGDGETADFRRVRCPAEARTVPLDQCLACAESAGVSPGPVARIEYASCRHAGAGTVARREDVRAAAEHTPVSAVMTTDVLAVRPDVSLETLTELFLERGFGGAPVVDPEGRPVGVISKTDLLERHFVAGDTGEATSRGWQSSQGRYRVQLGPGIHAEQLPGDSVDQAMTRGVLTVPEDTSVSRAAALMGARGVHRLLVVSEDGRLSGIVTSSDIMRWLAGRGGRFEAKA